MTFFYTGFGIDFGISILIKLGIMKRIFTFIIFAFAMIQISFADSDLFIKIKQQGNYKVYLNQEAYDTKKSNIVRFFDLIPGNYNLKVVRQMGWMQQIVYQENIQLQNGFRYAAELHFQYGLKMLAQIPIMQNEWYMSGIVNNNNNYPYPPNNIPYPNQPNWNDNNHQWNNGHWNNNYGMSDAVFNQLKNTVKNTDFDSYKMDVIKSSLANNYVSSTQVKELLYLVDFESNRLNMAKYCYGRTIDQQNYFVVYDAFNFSSSKKELGDYISNQN